MTDPLKLKPSTATLLRCAVHDAIRKAIRRAEAHRDLRPPGDVEDRLDVDLPEFEIEALQADLRAEISRILRVEEGVLVDP